MSRPNVILITIDALRADRAGLLGRRPSITPNLDRLANESMQFSQAITSGSWTQAALPGILTSTYGSWYGGCLGYLSPDRPSPVEALANSGYVTAAVSTSPWLSRRWGYDRGFEFFQDLDPVERDPFLRRIKGGQRLLRLPQFHQLGRALGVQTRQAKLYANGATVNETALNWLADTRQSFFLWLHYMDVHWPYHLEDELIDPAEIALAWQDMSRLFSVWRDCRQMEEDFRARLIDLYESAVAYVDLQIGKLVDRLQQMGLLDNTVVIVTADHGEEFCEHGRWGHTEVNLFDEIAKVPLIIRLPHHLYGRLIDRQVSLLDLMPTVLDLCGVESPKGVEGISMVPLWSDTPEMYDRKVAVIERARDDGYMIAVRTPEHKLLWDSRHSGTPQLYDLETDPNEQSAILPISGNLAKTRSRLLDVVTSVRDGAIKAFATGEHSLPAMDPDLVKRLEGLGYLDAAD